MGRRQEESYLAILPRVGWWRKDRSGSQPAQSSHETAMEATADGSSAMIRKLKSGEYRLYSRKKDPKTGKRRNLGTFPTREAAEKHERDVQFFKRH